MQTQTQRNATVDTKTVDTMVLEFLKRVSEGHEKLKKRIHSFRLPLSPRGQKFMGFVYFSIPCIIGYFVMEWTNQLAANNLGGHHEKLGRSSEATLQQNNELQKILDKSRPKL
eukprot:gene6497-13113_t